MTTWTKIDVEYVKMPNMADIPTGALNAHFQKAFIQFDVHPVRVLDQAYLLSQPYYYDGGDGHRYMGPNEDEARSNLNQFVADGIVFTHHGDGGWFLLASADRESPLGSETSRAICAKAPNNAVANDTEITLNAPLAAGTPSFVQVYRSPTSSDFALFVIQEGSLSADRRTFTIEPIDYRPVEPKNAMPFLFADLGDYGFAAGSQITVEVYSPGDYGTKGISPALGTAVMFSGFSAGDVDTLIHEMTHAFDMAHKCGNWDYHAYASQGDRHSCVMNYDEMFVLKDSSPRAPDSWTNDRRGLDLCADHIRALRDVNLEDLGDLGW